MPSYLCHIKFLHNSIGNCIWTRFTGLQIYKLTSLIHHSIVSNCSCICWGPFRMRSREFFTSSQILDGHAPASIIGVLRMRFWLFPLNLLNAQNVNRNTTLALERGAWGLHTCLRCEKCDWSLIPQFVCHLTCKIAQAGFGRTFTRTADYTTWRQTFALAISSNPENKFSRKWPALANKILHSAFPDQKVLQ